MHQEGVQDVAANTPVPVDANTLYLLGSPTRKRLCLRLAESWCPNSHGTTQSPHISRFARFMFPSSATVPWQPCFATYALSHATGLPQIDFSWYGAEGKTIIPPEKLMHILNHIPVFHDFRAKFSLHQLDVCRSWEDH